MNYDNISRVLALGIDMNGQNPIVFLITQTFQ